MALVPAKAFLLILLVHCFTVFGDSAESPQHNAPSHSPAAAPKQAKTPPPTPSQPPVQLPSQPPSHPVPKRSLLAVQGVVFCKSCKYSGVDTLTGATPLEGATVKLQCKNTKYRLVQEGKTDKNGYFFIMAPKGVTNFGAHTCRVNLVSSPVATCSKPTNLHAGLQGAILMLQKLPPVSTLPKPVPYQLYTVGPFAFEPSIKCSP